MQAQINEEIPLWPQGAVESNMLTEREGTNEQGHIFSVSDPSIRIFFPKDGIKNGSSIIICPGGGYGILASVHEGYQFAEWFAENGIVAVVLKYRMPNGHCEIPLSDVKQAMRIVRHRSGEWGINPQKIGVAGFSAGGHLASSLLCHFDEETRPDFGLLFYPVITMEEAFTHRGSRKALLGANPTKAMVERFSNEKQIKNNTPPTLIILSDDDKVVVPQNSLMFYENLKKKEIPSSMYIFPEGGHGWGFSDNFRYHKQMKALVLDWMQQQNIF
ncbi:peptidase S9 [Bacteroidales bacterium]|nr:peptidase S9 [Bacteroidales bacterium]